MALFWNLYARAYDSVRHLSPYQDMLKDVAQELADLPEGSAVLDAGCGSGNLLAHLAKNRPELKLYGVDSSHTMLKLCRKKAPNCRVIEEDVSRLPRVDDQSFDAVAMINVLYALKPEDRIRALESIKRVLKPTGRLILVNPVWNADPKAVLRKHTKDKGKLNTLRLLPKLLMLKIFLSIIERRTKSIYRFFNYSDMLKLGARMEIRKTYAEQNLLAVIDAENIKAVSL